MKIHEHVMNKAWTSNEQVMNWTPNNYPGWVGEQVITKSWISHEQIMSRIWTSHGQETNEKRTSNEQVMKK